MTTTLVSVEEYLHSTYEPDAEYVDGVIEERPAGEGPHSEWQATLAYFFMVHRREWHVRVRPSMRIQVAAQRYRVPDIAILDATMPREPIATVPPLIAIEILSPEDRLSRLVVRLTDFEAMSVPAIYVIDPIDNSLLRYKQGRLENAEALMLREITISFADILAELD